MAVLTLSAVPSARAQDATPPAGYPAAQPADPNGYPPPANNGYPPPANNGYPPPANNGYPPANGYPQQSVAAPQPYGAPAQPPPPAPRSPFLGLPFLGINSIQNSNSGTGPGFRIGGIGGFRMNEQVSLNLEAVYDAININNAPSGVSAYNFQFAAAPFFHVPASPQADIVIGPKLGAFHFSETENVSYYGYYASGTSSTTGWLAGINAGAFFRLSPVLALGGLVSFDYEKATSCSISGSYSCTVNSDADGLKMLSFAAGAMF
jgi:hypothetical protein